MTKPRIAWFALACLSFLVTGKLEMDITTNNHFSSQSLMLLLVVFFRFSPSIGISDTIYSGQSLSGNQTLTSRGKVFELGFFTPGNSLNYYIGIWYIKPGSQTVVWVANRNQPVSDPSLSVLKLLENGNLVLLSPSQTAIWSTNSKPRVSNSSVGVLLDNGNFVIRDELDSSVVIWQSFDHPTDTWLPGGKVGYNKLTNEKLVLRPWRNPQNPAPGIFSFEIKPNGTSHLLLWNGSKVYWNSGNWTGTIFSLSPEIQGNKYATNFTHISNENGSYFTYDATYTDALTRLMIDITGQYKQYVWGRNFGRWKLYWIKPPEQCEVYAFCGSFGKCNNRNTPLCVCLKGFEPKAQEDWELGDHSGGCMRKTPLGCGGGQGNDEFVVISDIRLPLDPETIRVKSGQECRLACLSDCSCTAYAYDDQCSIWKGGLVNLKQLLPDEKAGKYLYVKIAASDLKKSDGVKGKITWIIVGIVVGLCSLLGIVAVFVRRRYFLEVSNTIGDSLVLFRYRDLRSATKNFSEKLGEGGFGSVFKGTLLPNSTAIAVKMLKSLKHAEKQFRTEAMTIGTIQHVNLIRLRGFCVKASKRFLVLDYMPNGSLESLLFQKSLTILDWEVRYRIAIGTAKGLCYLHEECRDCIIHCDIKPENILLDSEYNPKLADFGLAKLVGRDFSRVLTTMRGTRGYLAPEWLSGQAITPKADVFSFGMVLFELISGRRNDEILEDEMEHYFPYRVSYSLRAGEENVVSFLDSRLEGKANGEELIRACKVACWCIQDNERDRPSMSLVVQILMGVVEVDVPPVSLFIQRLTGRPMEP